MHSNAIYFDDTILYIYDQTVAYTLNTRCSYYLFPRPINVSTHHGLVAPWIGVNIASYNGLLPEDQAFSWTNVDFLSIKVWKLPNRNSTQISKGPMSDSCADGRNTVFFMCFLNEGYDVLLLCGSSRSDD